MIRQYINSLLALLILVIPLTAQEIDRAPLRGMDGIRVLVEDIRPDAEQNGLYRTQIEADVELRLRKAGIRIFSEEEHKRIPSLPYLHIRIGTVRNDKFLIYAVSINVSLVQHVALVRDSNIRLLASTWNKEHVGTVGVYVIGNIRGTVGDLVDQFANDYLAANPKK